MILLRPGARRGQSDRGGLHSLHAFSGADFHDPAWTGFGALRVLNEDRLAPGAAIPPQRRANMELVDILLSGRLASRDGSGGDRELAAGDVLWLGAGHGLEHQAHNPDAAVPLHRLQAWLQPDRLNAAPASAQATFDPEARRGRWALLLSPDGVDGSLAIRLQACLRATRLDAGMQIAHPLDPARRYWLQVVSGEVEVAGHALAAGDALAFEAEGGTLQLDAHDDDSDVLLFDLPG